MSPNIKVYAGRFDLPNKGEDRYLVLPIGENAAGGYVAAIADGVSGEKGSIAAEWVIATLARIVPTMEPHQVCADSIYRGLLEALVEANSGSDTRHSATTLSCGVLKGIDGTSATLFEFFALGDSPIWKVIPSAAADYRYQAHQVYCEVKPAKQAAVYSSVGTSPFLVSGRPYFGAVRVDVGEALLVMSDGVPMDTILWDDQLARHRDSPFLLDLVMRPAQGAAEQPLIELHEVLTAYWRANLLVDDDASFVALAVVAEVEGDQSGDNSQPASSGDLWDVVDFVEEPQVAADDRPVPSSAEALVGETLEDRGLVAALGVEAETQTSLEGASSNDLRKVGALCRAPAQLFPDEKSEQPSQDTLAGAASPGQSLTKKTSMHVQHGKKPGKKASGKSRPVKPTARGHRGRK